MMKIVLMTLIASGLTFAAKPEPKHNPGIFQSFFAKGKEKKEKKIKHDKGHKGGKGHGAQCKD